MNQQKFQWDYPTQGMRYPRTMNEAFGPYATIPDAPQGITWTHVFYAAALILLALAAGLLWVTR